MDDIRHRFGSRLKQLRTQRGMTQQQLAERADISISFLGNMERGAKSPTIETLHKLSLALEVPMVALVDLESEKGRTVHRQKQVCKILCECIERIEQLYEK